MADLQHRIDALVDAAVAMSAAALAGVRGVVMSVVDSIGDLTQFEAGLNEALTAVGSDRFTARPMPQREWEVLLGKVILAAMLIGRESVQDRLEAGATRVLAETGPTRPGAEGFDPIPFDEAIAASMDRLVLTRPQFDQLSAVAKSRAFTFAWQDSVRILSAAHRAHLEVLASGGTLREFRLALPQMFEQEGWAGDRPWHADLVHRQQSQMAYMAGRFEQMTDAGVTHWRYSALQDARVRPTHAALDGKVFAMTDRRFYPPWDFNCRCAAEPIFDDEVEGVSVDRSEDLAGKTFGTDAVTGEPLRFPDHRRDAGATPFEWDPASFSRVEPLRMESVPEGLRATVRRVLSAQGLAYEEPATQDTEENALSEPRGLSPRGRRDMGNDQTVGAFRKSKVETMKTRELVLISDADLAGVPSRFRLMPWGTVETVKGPYLMDELAAREIVANFRLRGVDVVIDRDHQTLGGRHAAPDGAAPAMGWIKDLQVVKGDGLYALVDWTPLGREALGGRTYRYCSPVLKQREEDLRPYELHSVALTNKPATLGAEALVNQDDDPVADDRSGSGAGAGNSQVRRKPGEVPMKGIATLLALKEDASENDVMTAIRALHERAGQGERAQAALTLVCGELGVAADQPAEKIQAAVLALKGQGETIKALSEEVKGLRETVAGQQADALIAAAKKAGKLLDAQEEWARKLILADREQFVAWEKTAPVVRPQGRTEAPAETPRQDGGRRDRKTVALSARDEYRAKPELRQLVLSERSYVNGEVLAAGHQALSDEDVKELQLVG